MANVEEIFGLAAGKVWNALAKNTKLQEQKLIEECNIPANHVYGAIGWLARENKIRKEAKEYLLAETNLVDTIGTKAGTVWNTLNNSGATDVNSIKKYTKFTTAEIYQALGWLAREGKIERVPTKRETYKLK
ncbi:MAG: winged helix-turn-helix domain-containing protein [Candidatus Thermoplasmatota archaeon]